MVCDRQNCRIKALPSKIVGFEGEITRDLTKPEGAPRKLLSVEKLYALGWSPRIDLKKGVADAYRSFLEGHYLERGHHQRTTILPLLKQE
ncbi:putative GDP-L-fucose synthetase [Rhizobium sp. Pop5]|nr:putative GDP-L-fucose synthetase [Rhizobium sp. Pop5]